MNRKVVLITLFFLTVGFAAVSTNLFIDVKTALAYKKDDLNVYFSGGYIDNADYTNEIVSEDKSKIIYTAVELKEAGSSIKVSYDITNESTQYDALISITCTSTIETVRIENTEENILINAKEIGNGSTTITVSETITEDTEITCEMNITPLERTEVNEDILTSDNTYVVYGTYVGEDSTPIANANLVIYSSTPHYTTTDEEGYLFYNGIERGVHEIYYVNDTLENIKLMSKEEVLANAITSTEFSTNTTEEIVFSDNSKITNHGMMGENAFCTSLEGNVWDYDYTGDAQNFISYCDGTYKIELWGAQGNHPASLNSTGGLGAYTTGDIALEKNNHFYIYVGEHRTDREVSFNVGSIGGSEIGNSLENGYGGGGATDIRLVSGEWNNFNSLKSRIMVSAGGGGGTDYNRPANGGYGGTLIGGSGINGLISGGYANTPPTGGTQTTGGTISIFQEEALGKGASLPGSFGKGGDGNELWGSGGGGGYYGGAGGGWTNSSVDSGAGGSSFISGYDGCDAITEASTEDNIVHTGQANHYSGYVFTNSQMIAGNSEMPTHDGTSTMTGNSGNGYAKITFVKYEKKD